MKFLFNSSRLSNVSCHICQITVSSLLPRSVAHNSIHETELVYLCTLHVHIESKLDKRLLNANCRSFSE